MRSVWIAIAALAATAAVVLWSTGGTPATQRPDAAPHATEPTAEADNPATAAQPGDLRREVVSDEPDAPTLRWTVHVVDSETGAPVPGATVRSLASITGDDLDPGRRAHLRTTSLDAEVIGARFGRTFTADANGAVEIAADEPATALGGDDVIRLLQAQPNVTARAGERYGEATLPEPGGDVEIRIAFDRSARVQVVDTAGRPAAGVHVIHMTRADQVGIGIGGKGFMATTDAHGFVDLPHLQCRILHPRQTSDVAVSEPGLETEPVALDCLAPPREPIRIQMAPAGRVVVECDAPAGPELFGGTTLAVVGQDQVFSRRLEHGHAVFAWVGLGSELQVHCSGLAGTIGPKTFSGPTRADEVVVCRLDAADRPLLVAKLRAPSGDAVTGRPSPYARISWSTASGAADKGVFVGDDGVLRCLLDANWHGQVMQSIRFDITHGEFQGLHATRREANVPLLGTVDLGEVTLEEDPVLATGHLVDEAGNAILQAKLQIEAVGDDDARAPAVKLLGNGRFELRGDTDVARWRIVHGTAPGSPVHRLVAPIQFATGARDLEVVLAARGSIHVSFRHPAGRPLPLAVKLLPADGRPAIDISLFSSDDDRTTSYGAFELVPGRYTLTATLPGEADPILRVENIEITPGENHDPRVEDIELDGVTSHRIRLVAADGSPLRLRWWWLYTHRPGAPREWEGRAMHGNEGWLAARPGPIDVVCVVEGYHPLRVDGLTGDTELRLEELPTLSITLADDGALGKDQSASVVLEPLAPPGSESFQAQPMPTTATPWLGWISFRPGQTKSVSYDRPGRYRVRAQGWPSHDEKRVIPGTVEIGDEPGPITLHLR